MSIPAVNIPGGYILIARKILESELMDKPPHYLKLWVWMLGKAFWKDGDKLRRGQFHTTTAEMQEAVSYKIGYRKKLATKDEIRSAYEAFTKAAMITTTKATRGMVITVCNYDLYQNPNLYEGHNEAHNEPATHPAGQMKKEKKDKKEPKPLSSSGDEAQGIEVDFFLTKKKRKLTGKRLESFNLFWAAFDYKSGKAEAADSWLDIPSMTDSLVSQIVAAARKEAAIRPSLRTEGRTPKMAQGWISARRWEDETPAVALAGAEVHTMIFSPVTTDESVRLRKAMAKYDN